MPPYSVSIISVMQLTLFDEHELQSADQLSTRAREYFIHPRIAVDADMHARALSTARARAGGSFWKVRSIT